MADHRVTLNPCGYQRLMQFRCHLGDTVIFCQRVGIIAGAALVVTDYLILLIQHRQLR
jgi:hypothetical protein